MCFTRSGGSFWDRFGTVLDSFWIRFWIVLDSFWNRFGIVLESFWDRVGDVWLGIFDDDHFQSGFWGQLIESKPVREATW